VERRFKFGDNWKSYLDLINKERITNAQHALGSMLKLESLSGIRFLDVGSGSGLSSLSALNLGAEVTSFDYDQESVEATKQLKEMFASDSNIWSIEVGSVLDRQCNRWESSILYIAGAFYITQEECGMQLIIVSKLSKITVYYLLQFTMIRAYVHTSGGY